MKGRRSAKEAVKSLINLKPVSFISCVLNIWQVAYKHTITGKVLNRGNGDRDLSGI